MVILELAAIGVLLLVIAVVLAARLKARWPYRVLAYVVGAPLLTYGAVHAGTAYYDRTMCAGAESGDCLAGLGGMYWGAGVAALCLVVVVVIEVVRWRRRSAAAVDS